MKNTIVGVSFIIASSICLLAFTIGELVLAQRFGAVSIGLLIAIPTGLLFFGLGLFYLFSKPVKLQEIDPNYNPILREDGGEKGEKID